MCDYKGWQVSSNIEKTSAGTFKGIKRYNKSNWSWRSYVLHTAVEIRNSSQGLITEPYRDIVTKEKIYTYSFPIDQDHILFIDVLCHEDGSGNSEFLANCLI